MGFIGVSATPGVSGTTGVSSDVGWHILPTARNKTKRKKHREKEDLLCHTQIKNQVGRRINDDRVTKLALHHPIS